MEMQEYYVKFDNVFVERPPGYENVRRLGLNKFLNNNFFKIMQLEINYYQILKKYLMNIKNQQVVSQEIKEKRFMVQDMMDSVHIN